MVEGGDGAGLPLEEGQAGGVPGDLLGQHLDGHFAPEAGILCAIDLPHAAGAKKVDDLIRSESRPGHKSHGHASGSPNGPMPTIERLSRIPLNQMFHCTHTDGFRSIQTRRHGCFPLRSHRRASHLPHGCGSETPEYQAGSCDRATASSVSAV